MSVQKEYSHISTPRSSRLSEKSIDNYLQAPPAGWRSYTLSLTTLQRNSMSLLKSLVEQDTPGVRYPPVSWFELYRYAKPGEIMMMTIGLIMATLNGLFLPIGVIIYGEFTALLIDRTVMTGTSTPTITLSLFGGGKILTNATSEENRAAMIDDSIAFGIGCTVFSILQFIVAVISVDLFNYTALNQINRVKLMFLKAVLRQDIAWYDLNTTMNFATKVSDDIEKYREGIAEKVPVLVYLVQSFVLSVLISLAYGWELTLVILACCPIIIATTALVAKIQSSLTSQELKAYSCAGVLAEEVISSIRTVLAFGGEEKEIERYNKRLAPAMKTGSRKGVWSGVGSGIMWLIIYITYGVSFWYGVGLILDSREEANPQYNPAALMIIFISVLQGAQNVGLTAPHMEAIQCARASAASIMAVIDRKPSIDSLSEKGTKPELTGEMELRNVYFQYPARPGVQVLRGLNLSIKKNETVALVGPSGCGKSTVLQLLQRMYDPERGEVLASGYNLKEMNVRHLRNHIAVVGQEPVLFAGTIAENIRFGKPDCTNQEIYKATKEAYCHNFIRKLPEGYDTYIGERGAQLSGGQKQRIALARALVRDPKLLILDEATSALDSSSEARVQKALDDAAQSRTTVMVSHRLSTVLNATRIVFLDKGQVIEQGTHEDLIRKKGRYYQLVLEHEPGIAPSGDADKEITSVTKKMKFHQPKKDKLHQVVVKSSDSSSSGSDEEKEEKEEEEKDKKYVPTTWETLKLCAPEKYLMVGGLFAALCVGSSFPVMAILVGEIYGLLNYTDADWIRGQTNIIAVLFFLVGVYTGIAMFFQIYIFNLTGVRLTARLRVAVFRKMLTQEIGWFDDARNGVGALCAKLATDAAAVQGATGTRIGALMQASSTIVIGISISMFYTWKMTLVSLLSVPVVIGAVVLEGRVLAVGLASVREANNKATTIAAEAISNIRTVSSFCGEREVIQRYQASGASVQGQALKNIRWRGCVFAFGQTAPVAGYAMALWYGGLLVANKELHYKNVITVSEALIFGAWMMGQALAFAPNFGAAISAAERVMTLLGRETKVKSTKAPAVHENYVAKGKVMYRNIKFRYPTRRGTQVLKGLSMDIPERKRVAVVGPSGCGKSTLLQLLQRLYDPDEGATYLDEFNIVTDVRLTTLRANLGIVSQEPVLFDRTIRENIAYGDNTRNVSIEEIVKAAKAANVHSFIISLPEAYETRVGARASQLSGGQKQRIAIARALIRNPRVLLLDEATSALDAQSEKMVQESLDQASLERTCFIIAHRLTTIQNVDIIFVLDNGVVKEKGSHNDLIALKGLYAQLYELQCGLVEPKGLEKVDEEDEGNIHP